MTETKDRKLRVVVLMGGQSPEHDISLSTGRQVVAALDRSLYEVKAAVIGRDGRWLVPPGYTGEVPLSGSTGARAGDPLPLAEGLQALLRDGPDIAFLALHGPFGEDGTIQGLLEVAGIPYTGSGVLGSALAMDKEASRWLLERHGLPVPRTARVTARQWRLERDAALEGVVHALPPPPWFAKPPDQGSSVGIRRVGKAEELPAAIEEALRWSDRALVEELVEGDEVTCAVLGGLAGAPEALPPTQIIPREDAFFDFHAKYTPGATEEVTPARLPSDVIRRIQVTAARVHQILFLSGMSRTDMIVRAGIPVVLEVNTIPGMTETSLLPQAAAAAGISFPEVLDRILRLALEGSRRRG